MRRFLRLVGVGVAMLGLSALLVVAPPTMSLPNGGVITRSVNDDAIVAPAKFGVSFTPPAAEAAITLSMKIRNNTGSVLALRVQRPSSGHGAFWVSQGVLANRQVNPLKGVDYFCNSGTRVTVRGLSSGSLIHQWDCPTNEWGGAWRHDGFHLYGVQVSITWR